MHPRNRHQNRYDLKALGEMTPELKKFVIVNKYGDETIDFADKDAVKALNRAILAHSYSIKYWDIPQEYLCPPIPGRADYIHSASDLFPEKKKLHVLDIGTGANCIYPIIGHAEYDWSFVGSDINPKALSNAQLILNKNQLSECVELRLQSDPDCIFKNIIKEKEKFDLTICNPPFHESLEEATKGTQRKWKNLGKSPVKSPLNFGGKGAELWCPGGEKKFVLQMIQESLLYKNQVRWFTTLVSKSANLPILTKTLEKHKATIKVIDMSQGQKIARLLCWSYS